MAIDPKTSVTIEVELDEELPLEDLYPDGVPESVTPADILAMLKQGNRAVGAVLDEYGIDIGARVTVRIGRDYATGEIGRYVGDTIRSGQS